MSRLDWFSIISMCIGLIADVVTISAVLLLTNVNQTAPAAIWLLTLASIFITIVLIGFFSRRFFAKRCIDIYAGINKKNIQRIRTGARKVTTICAVILMDLL
jgi:uncharacterized membrane protein